MDKGRTEHEAPRTTAAGNAVLALSPDGVQLAYVAIDLVLNWTEELKRLVPSGR